MGIYCEINLFKSSDEVYQPGQLVSGIIRYSVDKAIDIEKITASLKGKGHLNIEVRSSKRTDYYTSTETYVNIQNIIQDVKCEMPVGSYEVKFNFILPNNIPSTAVIKRHLSDTYISGKNNYFIGLHFETSGFFSFNKKFKKELIVISRGIATVLREPVIYGEHKKLTTIFSSKNSTIRIISTIFDSVIPIGGKIIANCEVENNSNVLVNSVGIKLLEKYDFNAKGHREHIEETIPDADFKTTSINCGETQIIPIEITAPCDRHSLDYSNIISRQYALKIKAALPIPHRNIVLVIPVQIGSVNLNTDGYINDQMDLEFNFNEPPPTYWEAMDEKMPDDDINKYIKEN